MPNTLGNSLSYLQAELGVQHLGSHNNVFTHSSHFEVTPCWKVCLFHQTVKFLMVGLCLSYICSIRYSTVPVILLVFNVIAWRRKRGKEKEGPLRLYIIN
jgi:hypothetical protein